MEIYDKKPKDSSHINNESLLAIHEDNKEILEHAIDAKNLIIYLKNRQLGEE
jgi:hypothetical protein